MQRLLLTLIVLLPALLGVAAISKSTHEPAKGPYIGHMVYFKLKESTAENCDKLVASCDKYLEKHEGVIFYAAGLMGKEFNRNVNDRDWDVALHLVFDSKAAHDKYQDHPEHLKFIAENKESFAAVRVFDSVCKAPQKSK